MSQRFTAATCVLFLLGCSSQRVERSSQIPRADNQSIDPSSAGSATTASGPAAQVALQLNLDPHFLIGMGNDLAGAAQGWDHDRDGIYTLGTRLDLHYCYLVGLMGQGGWPDWNPGGWFVNIMTDSAARHGVVPMFTYYTMASWGEANMAVLTNDNFMRPFWNGVALLFDRLAVFNQPAVVNLEPDLGLRPAARAWPRSGANAGPRFFAGT